MNFNDLCNKIILEHDSLNKKDRIKAHKRLRKKHKKAGDTRLAKVYDTKVKKDTV